VSVALAIISNKSVVVASDSRVIHDGQKILSDCFNKTFSIPDKSVLGAYTGTMCFCGKSVGEHINEIVKNECKNMSSMEEMITIIAQSFSIRMKNISEEEVGFCHRKIDLLIADTHTLYWVRFEPNKDNEEICFTSPCKYYPYCVCGDDNAREATSKVLKEKENCIETMQAKNLISLAKRAIQKGIDNAGSHPQNPQICSCGGKIFHQCI